MDNLKQSPLQRIKKISNIVRSVLILFIIIKIVIILCSMVILITDKGGLLASDNFMQTIRFVLFSDGSEFKTGDGTFASFSNFSPDAKLLLIFGGLPLAIIILKGLYHMQKLFYIYAKGKIFTTEANSQIRKIGLTVCLYGLSWDICHLLIKNSFCMGLVGKMWGIGFMAPEFPGKLIMYLLIGAIVFCISWIMETGRELRVDHELTI